jgi:hypothetical protein
MIFILFHALLGLLVGTAPADTCRPETTPGGNVQPAEQPTQPTLALGFYTSGFL